MRDGFIVYLAVLFYLDYQMVAIYRAKMGRRLWCFHNRKPVQCHVVDPRVVCLPFLCNSCHTLDCLKEKIPRDVRYKYLFYLCHSYKKIFERLRVLRILF